MTRRGIMLLEFGGYNFTSFKEGFSISMRLGAGCPKDISKGKEHANLLAIKGANASGKTTVLKAISFLCHFSTSSFNYKPDATIPVDSYFNNKKDTDFYAIFEENGKEYQYDLTLNEKEVVKEVLSINGKEVVIRDKNVLKVLHKDFNELKIIKKIRDNASFISIANQYDLSCMQVVYSLFSNAFSNVAYDGLRNEMIDYRLVSKHYHENEELLEFTKNILQKADTGIENIVIIEQENDETREITHYPVFTYMIDEEELPLVYDHQSSGVKALYKYLAAYKSALDEGGLLILDELDINLHPDLLEAIISLFDDSDINKYNAQLIFTTHNEKIMDKLKKYRLVFVNKENNESYLYRLDETGEVIRNDRSIMPLYNSGSLGGKPKLKF